MRPFETCIIAATATAVLVGCADSVDPTNGYYLAKREAMVVLSDADEAGPFAVVVRRQFETREEEQLLALAEAVYPTHDAIIDELRKRGEQLTRWPPPQDQLWWWNTFDGMRIPYAVTNGAVAYYLELTRAFRRGAFDSLGTSHMKHSGLQYLADVTWHNRYVHGSHTFDQVFVVDMTLEWSAYCSPVCELTIQAHRVVVLGSGGILRGVFGDGLARYIVS